MITIMKLVEATAVFECVRSALRGLRSTSAQPNMCRWRNDSEEDFLSPLTSHSKEKSKSLRVLFNVPYLIHSSNLHSCEQPRSYQAGGFSDKSWLSLFGDSIPSLHRFAMSCMLLMLQA